MYIKDVVASIAPPVKKLVGFRRIYLKGGEEVKVSVKLPVNLLAFYNKEIKKVVEPGEIKLMIGSSSEDIRLDDSFYLVGDEAQIDETEVYYTEVEIDRDYPSYEKDHLILCEKPIRPKEIILFGGEPFMLKNKDLISHIFEKGERLGYRFRVITNGVEIREFIPVIERYPINAFRITLDGPKRIHDARRFKKDGSGTFDEIVTNIELLREIGMRVVVRVTIDNRNLEHLPEFKDFVRSMEWEDAPNIFIAYDYTTGSECSQDNGILYRDQLFEKISSMKLDDPLVDIFFETYQARNYLEWLIIRQNNLYFGPRTSYAPSHKYCAANFSSFIYNPHGEIYPCIGTDSNPDYKIGAYLPNFKLNENYELWRNRSVFNIPACRDCKYAFICGGGCTKGAYEKNGAIKRQYCNTFKKAINYKLPFLYKMMKLKKNYKTG